MNTTCPNCNNNITCPDHYVGKPCICPHCQHSFTAIPTVISQTAPNSKRERIKPLNRNLPFPLPPERPMSASFCGINLHRNSYHRHPHLSSTGNIPHTSGRIWPYYPACPSSLHGVACCCQHHQASCLYRQK